jgi:uncharacterized protein
LAVLMLRGPQTAAELRVNCERLHRFADVSSVEAFLEELAEREPAWAVKLARAPGAREARWVHLVTGPLSAEAAAELAQRSSASAVLDEAAVSASELATLRAEVQRLGAQVADLQAVVQRMAGELGLPLEG